MSQTERSTGEDSPSDSREWLAMSTLRIGLAVIGFVLLLFAIGQMIGFDLLEQFTSALTSEIGRWLIVAIVALIIIVAAIRGFDDVLQ